MTGRPETSEEYGIRVLGRDRHERGLEAIVSLVCAASFSEEAIARSQCIPAEFLDKLELRIEAASGGRKRTLLEVYDLFLETIDEVVGEVAREGRPPNK